MHQSPSRSAVLVLSLPAGSDPAGVGCEISGLPGIVSVTAYPERGQLVVRYDALEVTPAEIRACLLPELETGPMGSVLLAAWPRVVEVLPIAVGLL